ncbi:phosphate transport system permease protein PstA [Hymenobacter qilianensis]|uniref:Phosphate transport system permease protein PstA n=1 Tax=Hymenobacter qilianensis TaxID=1385715 RepID=A0ACB5PUW2_9BACT|nr:phosphate ABC transporter permease PstA [Hymenobacter qilianensis]GGF74154.1 phosphate transport system permease protein PstA [Hymenobacter qilianensis]
MSNMTRNRLLDGAFRAVGLLATLLGLLLLAVFLLDILRTGLSRLSWQFLSALPSRFPERAGIYTALLGTVWIMVLTALIAVPVGLAAGVYLEEYGRKSRWSALLEINITNLAGVPSVIYGLLGLNIFVRFLRMGSSVLAASCTLALLILPILIVATREAIRAVPKTLREASFALGATRWQTIWYQVLPASMGGILTGIILALSRAVGETAPLLVLGVLAYVPFAPKSPLDEFSALPVQIFNWISRPQQAFGINAAAAIIVLLLITFGLNGLAIFLRNRWRRHLP